ncbi:MAG TPA: hypothetical protein VD861_15605 [Pyrinomonadaceae bacterium]|jgi:hypothetical protein|nr:hypothetical protein [Pyrinomonadaceae bacterium]
MSCRNYETILTEVARGQMLDARAKRDALAHAETCPRCAARLADEKALSAGLRSLSASAAAPQTPARVEAALLAAFRRQSSSVPEIAPVRAGKSRWMRWPVAAAAAILVVSAFAALRLLPAGVRETAKQGSPIAEPSPIAFPAWWEDERSADDTERQLARDRDARGRRLVPVTQFPRNLRDGRRGLVHEVGVNRGRTSGGVRPEAAASPDAEIATDFMPLTYGGSLSQLDDGQVVRVELPRSALHSFGLPVNAERGGGRVKADVLLGHDGVARAIRFVR